MKKYNIQNYIRYKNDVAAAVARLKDKMWDEYTREELTTKFLPLVENIARKFATSQQASGVMSIMDMIQSGNLGLVQAVRKLDYEKLHLTDREYQVLRLSYGLDCDKHSATEIADYLGIEGTSSYVRISQLKRQAVDKLIENVDHSQVLDFV